MYLYKPNMMNRNMNTMLSTTLKISMRFGALINSNDNDGVVDDDNIGLIYNARTLSTAYCIPYVCRGYD